MSDWELVDDPIAWEIVDDAPTEGHTSCRLAASTGPTEGAPKAPAAPAAKAPAAPAAKAPAAPAAKPPAADYTLGGKTIREWHATVPKKNRLVRIRTEELNAISDWLTRPFSPPPSDSKELEGVAGIIPIKIPTPNRFVFIRGEPVQMAWLRRLNEYWKNNNYDGFFVTQTDYINHDLQTVTLVRNSAGGVAEDHLHKAAKFALGCENIRFISEKYKHCVAVDGAYSLYISLEDHLILDHLYDDRLVMRKFTDGQNYLMSEASAWSLLRRAAALPAAASHSDIAAAALREGVDRVVLFGAHI